MVSGKADSPGGRGRNREMKELYRTFDEYMADLMAEKVTDERMKVRVRNALAKYRITDLESFAALTVQDALKWDGFGKESVTALIEMGVGVEPRVPSDVTEIVDVESLMNENYMLRDLASSLYGMLSDERKEAMAADMVAAGIDVA